MFESASLDVVVCMWNVSPWFADGGAVWEGCGNFQEVGHGRRVHAFLEPASLPVCRL